jgi:ABC-type antimicrobial peptide transport system permease subunit
MALGAETARVLWMVLRETLILVGLGVAIGIPLALVSSRLVESMLYGLKSNDVVTMLAGTLILLAIGAFAGWLPARRASRVDPMIALRYE